MNRFAISLRLGTGFAVLALAACSGGGGGSSPLPAPVSSSPAASSPGAASPGASSPTAVPASTTFTASGTVYDLPNSGTAAAPGYSVLAGGIAAAPGAAIANANVYVGSVLVLGATAPATVPSFVSHAITTADGSFAIAGLAPGRYALTIFAPAPHVAIVHRDLTVGSGTSAGAYLMATLTPSEAAWFGQEAIDRSAYGANPLVLDEAELEAARYWSGFMASNNYFAHCVPASTCETGSNAQTPAVYGPQDVDPQHRYAYFHGFSGGSVGENIAAGFSTWATAEAAFMQEASACPNAQPLGCVFTEATGHFLNIVNQQYVWSAVAIASSSNATPYYDEEFTLVSSTMPTSAVMRTIHPELGGRKP